MYQVIKKACLAYLNTGVDGECDPEQARRTFVINLFTFVGGSITGLLGIRAFLKSDIMLASALFTATLTYAASHYLQRLPSDHKGRLIPSILLQFNLMALMLYLVVTGGVENTGPLWMFLIPPVFMFIAGQQGGYINIGIFICCYSIIMFYPGEPFLLTSYTFEFKTRALMAFATLTFLAGFYEYSRHSTFMHLKDLSDRFERQARRDPLTKLPNRRAMLEQLEYEYSRTKRSSQVFSIMLLDVDGFKQFNDTYGHDGGDEALIQLAEYFDSHRRQQDVVCRWGGEEFLFLLPHTSIQDAKIYAEKIRQGSEHVDIEYDGLILKVTVSIGVSQVSSENSIQEAVLLADKRLYLAKERGRNQVVSD